MIKKKMILVTGATGAQGGSVAKALLQKNEFAVRILTRNPASPKAKALQAMGAEVVAGDMAHKRSLWLAMQGCYGVFGVTNYWEHYQQEYDLGVNLVEAVAENSIQHFVLHTLPAYHALSNGKYEVPHYDIKAALKQYSKMLSLPATYLQLGFYYENFYTFFPPLPDQFGTFQFGFPQGHTKLAMVSVEDVGPMVANVFANPRSFIGRTLTAVGADDTCDAYAAAMTRILELPVQYNYVPHELYRSFDIHGAEELANMFEVQRLYIRDRRDEMKESYSIHPGLKSFEHWLKRHKNSLVAHLQQYMVTEEVY